MKKRNQDLELLIYEHLDDIYMSRIMTFIWVNEAGSTYGEPRIGDFELFKKGPKPFTYSPLERPDVYYYTIGHVQSSPTVIDELNIYSLREIYHFMKENNDDIEFPQLTSHVKNQINNLDKLLDKKSRTR